MRVMDRESGSETERLMEEKHRLAVREVREMRQNQAVSMAAPEAQTS